MNLNAQIKECNLIQQGYPQGSCLTEVEGKRERACRVTLRQSEEGFLRLEYGKLVAVGIGSIQEQHTRITNIKERINILKSKVLNG